MSSEQHHEFVERMNMAHQIIENLFKTVRLSDKVKLVVITGTEEDGEVFIITYTKTGIFQVLQDEGKIKFHTTTAHDFIGMILMDSYIAAIELEDQSETRISVF